MTDAPATLTRDGHLWVTVPEAARRLGVTTGRVYHLTPRRLTTQTFHARTYIRADSVEAYRRYRDQLVQLRAAGRSLDLARR